ncbi:hypothetical protein ACFWUZ_19610 [Streptomyces sp. NPDC058646]|uniref:hypothetical protein n=1 Tax=Streptomyces sp. NPDC058646 TaxID=3346574 RepID=UPI0036601A35
MSCRKPLCSPIVARERTEDTSEAKGAVCRPPRPVRHRGLVLADVGEAQPALESEDQRHDCVGEFEAPAGPVQCHPVPALPQHPGAGPAGH